MQKDCLIHGHGEVGHPCSLCPVAAWDVRRGQDLQELEFLGEHLTQ